MVDPSTTWILETWILGKTEYQLPRRTITPHLKISFFLHSRVLGTLELPCLEPGVSL